TEYADSTDSALSSISCATESSPRRHSWDSVSPCPRTAIFALKWISQRRGCSKTRSSLLGKCRYAVRRDAPAATATSSIVVSAKPGSRNSLTAASAIAVRVSWCRRSVRVGVGISFQTGTPCQVGLEYHRVHYAADLRRLRHADLGRWVPARDSAGHAP